MLAERAYFYLSLALGRLLRAGRYSSVRVVDRDGELEVRKRRSFYAPALVSLGGPIVRILNTGMRVLPQVEWEARERSIYERLYGTSPRVDADGTLVLPHLAGETLATLLDDATLGDAARQKAIELAVVALAELHAHGFTHADAMAENVMVDLDAGVARWFDFETVHDSSRPVDWRRADDVRALIATALLRTPAEDASHTLALVLDSYADETLTPWLETSFTTAFPRSLAFHLGQAPLSFRAFREIGRWLKDRIGG